MIVIERQRQISMVCRRLYVCECVRVCESVRESVCYAYACVVNILYYVYSYSSHSLFHHHIVIMIFMKFTLFLLRSINSSLSSSLFSSFCSLFLDFFHNFLILFHIKLFASASFFAIAIAITITTTTTAVFFIFFI
jgi:hypothetical protein